MAPPPPPVAAAWHVAREGQTFGPFGPMQLQQQVAAGTLTRETHVWCAGMSGWQPAGLAEGKLHGRAVIARLEGIEDRDAATDLLGSDIGVDREALPDPGEGRYYWADLEGLTVVHEDGSELGKVAYLMATGANDVLVVDGPVERLIPFVPGDVILDVDLAAGVIRVDWEWD